MPNKDTRQAPIPADQERQPPGEPDPANAAQSPALRADAVNILIVDDEPKNLTVLESLLDDPGYRVVRAESADQALLALVAEDFALLILDIRMPDMTGFELAQMIKERKKTAQVPIIFLTAYYNEDQHVLEGYGSGAVDYLHKPVNSTILRSKVAVFAELYRKSRECGMANRALLIEVSQRRRAEEQLRQLNDTLEQRVMQRTEALRASEEKYRSLFDSIDEGFCIIEKVHGDTDAQLDFRHIEVNPAFEIQAGVSNVVGKTLRQAFPDLTEQWYVTYNTILDTGEPSRLELELSAGGPVLELYAFRVEGETQGRVAVIFKDISVRKRVDLELKDALAAAEKANRAKSDFLSSMSHELRTPLNAILGFAQLLEAGSPPPTAAQNERLQQIIKAGWYLLELINRILELTVIESGKLSLSLSLEPVSLTEAMRECQALIEPQAQQRDIRIYFLPFENTCIANADRTRVKQVMINLLSNAIKYNREHGTVEVKCTASMDRVRISIKDSGAGLSQEKLAQLFQPFNRLGQETGNEVGTGIGLVVTKQLVELMGGTIGVESAVGVGSEFWIELIRDVTPQLATDSTMPAELAPQTHENAALRTLLYVEDNPANLMLVEQIIEGHPHMRMLSAHDGNLGIALARTHLPDVILLDINLPGISGFQALKTLREDPLTAHIPVIALSANAMPHDIEKGLEVGFFRYLTKPIKINELMDALGEALTVTEAVLLNTNESE
jgi:signal transduction histidine kinase/DNA-binding response OmpR family regulator